MLKVNHNKRLHDLLYNKSFKLYEFKVAGEIKVDGDIFSF